MKRYLFLLAGIMTGGFAGYLYYQFVGCASATCPITSHAMSGILYGSLMGGLAFSLFKRRN